MTVNIDEIQKLIGRNLTHKSKIIVYDFFETKGHTSVDQAILTARLYLKFIEYGAKVVLCFGDWVAHLIGRFGGDLEKIKTVGLYYIEILKGLGVPFGDNDNEVSLIFQKELFGSNADYWELTIDVSQKFTAVVLSQIIGTLLNAKDLNASHVILPCHLISNMFFSVLPQTSSSSASSSSSSPSSSSSSSSPPSVFSIDALVPPDIVILQPELQQLSDILNEYCDRKELPQPVIFSQSVLLPLTKPGDPISPASNIFIEEQTVEIQKKINKAFFDAENMSTSPLINWLDVLLLPALGTISVNGRSFASFTEIEPLLKDRTLSIKDFKEAVAVGIDTLLRPLRAYLDSGEHKTAQTSALAILDGKPEKKGEKKDKKKEKEKEKEKK